MVTGMYLGFYTQEGVVILKECGKAQQHDHSTVAVVKWEAVIIITNFIFTMQ